jgi:hypothetical protein
LRATVRTLGELGEGLVLAPERWLAIAASDVESVPGVALGELVVERRERAEDIEGGQALVVDTTHARDGLFDVPAARRAASAAKSAKKAARAGDLVVSRLRPYLRQIAFVHPLVLAAASGRPLALSTEFYVLAPARGVGDLAFLLPFLLAPAAQATLAAAQEGGHHPRVPRSSLLSLRVPHALVAARAAVGAEVRARLAAVYEATARYQQLLDSQGS